MTRRLLDTLFLGFLPTLTGCGSSGGSTSSVGFPAPSPLAAPPPVASPCPRSSPASTTGTVAFQLVLNAAHALEARSLDGGDFAPAKAWVLARAVPEPVDHVFTGAQACGTTL